MANESVPGTNQYWAKCSVFSFNETTEFLAGIELNLTGKRYIEHIDKLYNP